MIDNSNPEIQFAMEAVRAGALLAREVEREMVEPVLTKEDRSPVTVADFAVQGLIGCLREKTFPAAVLVAEALGAATAQSPAGGGSTADLRVGISELLSLIHISEPTRPY